MSNYSFKIKAILDAATIQAQLNKLSENFKPINIDLAKSINLNQVADQLNSATLASARLNESGKVTATTIKSIGDSFDLVAKATERGSDLSLNFESSQKRAAKAAQAEADAFVKGAKAKQAEEEKMQKLWDANVAKQEKAAQTEANLYTKNQQAISSLTIRVEGLTDAQRERISAEQRLAEISSEKNIKKQAILIQGLTKDLSAASYGMTNFASSIDYTIKRFMEIGAITLAFRTIKNIVSDMVKTVSELDASLVEVQKVTDLTGKSLETFTNRSFAVGSEVARTGKEVIDATAIFARSGYEIKEALDLSKVAMIMMNVGDGINSTSEAATSLISVLKGYNLEANEAIKVTDLINEVSNNAAINFEDLTEGLTRTSAVFNQAGVSIEKLSGLLTGTNEILQNVEMSSTGLITISQRCIYYTLIINHGAYVQKCA